MRRILLLVPVLLAATPLAAQPTRTQDPQTLYQSYALDVRVIQTTYYETIIGSDASATVPVGTNVRWQGYVGARRVGEAEFYRHAGDDELADQIAKSLKRGRIVGASGLALILGGAGVAAVGYLDQDENGEPKSEVLLTGGGISFLVGTVLLRAGTLQIRQYTSPDRARATAIRFNRSLTNTIQRQ